MRIEIEIPKEFEEHFIQDRFEDALHRLSVDAHLIAGRYEQETAEMLIKAFKESKHAYDVDKVVEQLETLRKECEDPLQDYCPDYFIDRAVDMVKGGGVNE